MKLSLPDRLALELAIREGIEAYVDQDRATTIDDEARLAREIADKLENFEEVDPEDEDDEPETE